MVTAILCYFWKLVLDEHNRSTVSKLKKTGKTHSMKKITYFVQRFRPKIEATSKEVHALWRNFQERSSIHDLHLDSKTKFKYFKGNMSYHFIYYPFTCLFVRFFSMNRIKHVYTSLVDFPYLCLLSKKNMVLTSTNFFTSESINKRLKHLKKLKKIIVEAEIQKKELIKSGIEEEKIELIYPPVNLDKFGYKPASGSFKILNASCPTKLNYLSRRGIIISINSIAKTDDVTLHLLWRDDNFVEVQKLIETDKVTIRKEIIKDMNEEYSKYHAVIIPYLDFDENLKLIPNSAVESLAAGKPVLVSSKTGIASIIEQERCGVVFEPNEEDLVRAIEKLKENYDDYQKNCRRTTEKYFSEKKFIQAYRKIYDEE